MNASTFVDFSSLKETISIHQAMSFLNLKMKQEGGTFRGICTACKSGGDRALVVTPSKGAFYCFAAKKGGDQIALVAHVNGISQRDAAMALQEHFGAPPSQAKATPVPQGTKDRPFNAEQYLKTLDPKHESLQSLGIAAETFQIFKSGYSKSGVNRERLALAMCDFHGAIVGFCGRSLTDESPLLKFPAGFDPHSVLFGAERVQAGPLFLVRDPLQVLSAYEAGVENVIAFLTDTISVPQLQVLEALMDEKKCQSVELY